MEPDSEKEPTPSFPAQSLLASLVQLTKEAAQISTYESQLNKAATREYSDALSNVSTRLVALCNDLLDLASNVTSRASPAKRAYHIAFNDFDEVIDSFADVEEVVDNLLELAHTTLDEATGRSNEHAPNRMPSAPQGYDISKSAYRGRRTGAMGIPDKANGHTAHFGNKPQFKFEEKVDNSNDTPWAPKVVEKYHALKPWNPPSNQLNGMPTALAEHVKSLGLGNTTALHPYEYEIQNIQYPDWMFASSSEQLWRPFEDADYTYVSTVDDLRKMVSIMEAATEIAVDTEHHDYRTYLGIVCLIQISTRNEDFIVDTLGPLRSHLYLLNRVFANPRILKVFHGAEMDVLWLQRDFGVYIVNLFDTFHASNVLEMSAHSLHYLLQYFCNVETDKAYQMSDWRIRPLPPPMLKYARMDTHYLLYIWDRMRNELLTRSPTGAPRQLMNATLRRSEATALQVFEKPYYDAESGDGPHGWHKAMTRSNNMIQFRSPEQIAVFKALHGWRDHIARVEDESTRYVMPTHVLFTIAERMPEDVTGLLGCCLSVHGLVRTHAKKLVELIEHARVEARQMAKARQEESQRLIAAHKPKTLGQPVHTRFDSEDDLMEHASNPLFSSEGVVARICS
ncbi:hypothetical protein SeMB42_g04051 [Synchytrium endobioticum]|uniref:HRDC domain-containing protein n=1 Tax=Synchytrium endobioticum TaxID=286115 RepID=A0A507D204_9FUNG|nr:hypothetical protein SeMB42_g04051 [Synchytrium endobioticum]TPX51008.1 hypothetical protein SeLEV6574_g00592 [Synchytrium endobioticum]